MSKIELKPCPFCGGEARKIAQQMQGANYIAVQCTRCGSASYLYETANPRVRDEENPAIKSWNRRVEK